MTDTALVTGGGRGIGRAIVERFFEEDRRVLVHYNQSEGPAREVLEEGEGRTVQADLGEPGGIDRLRSLIAEERPDVVVNNAGVIGGLEPGNFDLEEWERTFRVNATAPALLCEAAAGAMEEGGRIVNVGSIRGLEYAARPGITAYSASKAALRSTTKSLAQHYAPELRINAVDPGFTATEMTADLDEETKREVEEKTPMDRFGDPEEIAEAVHFLTNPRCQFLTGETLVVDGGYSIAG